MNLGSFELFSVDPKCALTLILQYNFRRFLLRLCLLYFLGREQKLRFLLSKENSLFEKGLWHKLTAFPKGSNLVLIFDRSVFLKNFYVTIVTSCISWTSSAKIWSKFPPPLGWMEAYFMFFGSSSWRLILFMLELVQVAFLVWWLWLFKALSCCWFFVPIRFYFLDGRLLLKAAVYVLLVCTGCYCYFFLLGLVD